MSKIKYKIGDKVKVRRELKVGNLYNGCEAVKEMVAMAGEVVTIDKVAIWSRGARYTLAEDQEKYAWSDDMFEPIHEDKLVIICRDGRETVARYYRDKELICSAGATRNPEDVYDFFTGARFAFDRANKYSKLFESKSVFNPETDLKDGMFVRFKGGWAIVCGDYFVTEQGLRLSRKLPIPDGALLKVVRALNFEDARHGGEVLYEKPDGVQQ